MPAGVPVATFAIGAAGATNAALFAASILAARHPEIGAALRQQFARRRQQACSPSPTRAPRPDDRRHRRRRPARPHAGPRRLSAGARLPVPGPQRRYAGGAGRAGAGGRIRRPGAARRAGAALRRAHLRLGEHPGRRAARRHARPAHAHRAAARGRWPPRRTASRRSACSSASASRRRVMPRSTRARRSRAPSRASACPAC